MSIPILRRKISAAYEWFQIWSQPHAHRPATVAGGRLNEGHVNTVDIRTFLPIHLNVYELAIHDLGCVITLERLMSHNVTPMAGGIANRQEDRLILPTRFLERFFAPWIPIHWIMRVLEKVR